MSRRKRRRPQRRSHRRGRLVVLVILAVAAAFVVIGALVRQTNRAPQSVPFRFPTVAAATPTAEIEASERQRLDVILDRLQETPAGAARVR